MKSKKILFILLFPLTVLAQKQLTEKEIKEDYSMVKEVLKKAHPSLYEYTSKSKWDSLFIDFEERKLKTLFTDSELFKSIAELTDHVRDGHLIVMRPQLDSIPKIFPLWVKIINGTFYTDTDDFDIPVGSEIISIDGIVGDELLKKLFKYAPSDGYNTTKKERQVEQEFGILHFYEFGAKSTYKVVYRTPSFELNSKIIDSQSFDSIGKRFWKRNSHFGVKTFSKKEPFLYFIDSLNTSVLTINTFGLEQEIFQSKVKDLFRVIKRKRIKHLIIDLRRNEGGYPENSNFLFSFIAKESFIQPKSQHVITDKLPLQANSKEVINDYTYEAFFAKFFKNGLKKEKEWVIHAPKSDASMSSKRDGFKGQVFVLVGGKTFSAGSTFALNCKNQGILLIGEETGGGYYSHTGGFPIIYELPNSKIKILISLVKMKKNTNDQTISKGSGVLPDVEIKLTVEDLIRSRDSQLAFILKQINKE